MADTETPYLHLGLADDERTNRNLTILDAFMRRLDRGTIIPEGVLIQGDLEVQGNASVHGNLTVDGSFQAAGLSVQHLTATADLTVAPGALLVLPNASVANAALKRGSALWDYATGTAQTNLPIVDFELRELARVQLSNEGSFNPTLVLATGTLQFQIGPIAGPRTITVETRLLSNVGVTQTRDFSYTYQTANNLSIDCPYTMARFANPGSSEGVWSLEAYVKAGIPGGGGIAVISKFAQLIAVQLR